MSNNVFCFLNVLSSTIALIVCDSSDDSHTLRFPNIRERRVLNMNEPETSSLLANVTWTVSNLCRGKPLPPLEYIEPAIAPIASLLRRQHVSDDVLVDAVWALSYMSDGDNDRIQKVMDTGITKELVGMLQKSNTSVLTPSLRTMGNFVTGSDQQTQEVVDAGVVQYLFPLLDHPNVSAQLFNTMLVVVANKIFSQALFFELFVGFCVLFFIHSLEEHPQGNVLVTFQYCSWYNGTA